MKSRTRTSPLKPSEEEIFNEVEEPMEALRPASKLPTPVRPPSSFDATFLQLLGLGLLGLGVALSLGPKMSWKLNQVADGFKYLGVQGGALAVGGILLVGMGLLRRGQIALRTPTEEQAEDRLLIEQLSKDSLRVGDDLARLESGLTQITTELARSRRTMEERLNACTQEIIGAIPLPKAGPSADDAIFRLAASLDQVGARIEQRLKTQYNALQDHLEDVGAAILSARNQMQGLEQVGGNHAAVLREEVQAQVEVALEETGFWANGGRNPNAPSLGLLDTLGDPQVHSQHDVEAVQAPLPQDNPSGSAQPQVAPMMFNSDEVDTKTRLVQLSSLLADPKLRQALEGLRDQAPQ
jgi:hypothetical protein